MTEEAMNWSQHDDIRRKGDNDELDILYQHTQGIWRRPDPNRDEFVFDQEETHQGVVYDVATITLTDVPIGWAILSVWCEDADGHTITKPCIMNVWVYPEINCWHDGTRWRFRRPRNP
ncbi:MAG: hypothetical protein JW941_09590, partial [Candidatus Coatesbacteria bacterium]|nr:hypothetical protein [Candidatus Coatesbacteria bacterium]